MAVTADTSPASYISAHSADVILSEIRPIKLKIEALTALNVLLDEFLYNILKSACSLSTDKLRASLLSLLPTTLGKEALLEAEVELRAYWDRTVPPDNGILDDDPNTFHLRWAFELLRLKCEAYSTLNESDEDHALESHMSERMVASGGALPKATIVAPAALYLTAIIEALCEHILSNVGRVVARDSSRTSATAQDLFVALCEDHSIYSLFRTMKVYEQIEELSKVPKVRRSKSLTRTEKSSRTSSPHADSRSIPSEGSVIATNNGSTQIANSTPRSSLERNRALKIFKASSRSSLEREYTEVPSHVHRRSDSVVSGDTYDEGSAFEEDAMQQVFDDLMRSSSTMKVSLTPDRLKTMEAYKQEKERGNKRQLPSLKSESGPSVSFPSRATGRRPSLLHVESIKEDDDDESFARPQSQSQSARSRQTSVSSPPTSPPLSDRVRSSSTTNGSVASQSMAKLSNVNGAVQRTHLNSPPMQQPRRNVIKSPDPFPPKTRKIQRNRESLDLDEVMDGSDDDDDDPLPPKPPAKTDNPKRNGKSVSASTKELMDFLAEGPPDTGGASGNFQPDGPLAENAKPKGGRLQRMISKLSLSERSRNSDDFPKFNKFNQPIIRSPTAPNLSSNNLSSLANRPIPPRPHLVSPSTSPVDTPEELSQATSRLRSTSLVRTRRPPPTEKEPVPVVPVTKDHGNGVSPRSHVTTTTVHGHAQSYRNKGDTALPVSAPPRAASAQADVNLISSPSAATENTKIEHHHSSIATPQPSELKPSPIHPDSHSRPHISATAAQEMHKLFARAATANECRLILDMFLAKSGVSLEPSKHETPHPPSSPSVITRDQPAPSDSSLESMMVEFFL